MTLRRGAGSCDWEWRRALRPRWLPSVAAPRSRPRRIEADDSPAAPADPARAVTLPQGIDLEKWNRIKGAAYEIGDFPMPGVCQLPGPQRKRNWPDRDKYRGAKTVPGMCQLCSTVCGIVGHVKDGRLLKLEGNPNDPNSRGHLCARGQAGLNHQYHPERLLYPLRRVGARGEGKWKRITWDEALDEIAERLKQVRVSGRLEEFAFHQGRQRSRDALKRFLDAFGTKTQLSHRSLCSGNRRAANLAYLWESDWDLNDVEHSKYILNFGSNAFEAHQGHVPFRQPHSERAFSQWSETGHVRCATLEHGRRQRRVVRPVSRNRRRHRVGDGARDSCREPARRGVHRSDGRTSGSTTARPSSALLAGMGRTGKRRPGRRHSQDRIEFAKAAPACTTMCNRGSSAHFNGFYNDRAIHLLNALTGSVGKKGGWCWSPWGGLDPQSRRRRCRRERRPGACWKIRPSIHWPTFGAGCGWGRSFISTSCRAREAPGYMTYNLDSPLTWPEEESDEAGSDRTRI